MTCNLIGERREPRDDVVVVAVDRSASQRIGVRDQQTDEALAALQDRLGRLDGLQVKVVTVTDGGLASAAPVAARIPYGPAGTAPAKTPGATFYIPNENEWYKAAYYSPNYGGVGVPGYYAYATQSDSAPGGSIGSAANQANYVTGIGYSVTQDSNYDPNQNYLTDVGAFTNSLSLLVVLK